MSNPQVEPSSRRGSPSRVLLRDILAFIPVVMVIFIPVVIVASTRAAIIARSFAVLPTRRRLARRKLRPRSSAHRESPGTPAWAAGLAPVVDAGFAKPFGKISARARVQLAEAETATAPNSADDGHRQGQARHTRGLWERYVIAVVDSPVYAAEHINQVMVT